MELARSLVRSITLALGLVLLVAAQQTVIKPFTDSCDTCGQPGRVISQEMRTCFCGAWVGVREFICQKKDCKQVVELDWHDPEAHHQPPSRFFIPPGPKKPSDTNNPLRPQWKVKIVCPHHGTSVPTTSTTHATSTPTTPT